MNIGETLKFFRTKKKLTQKELIPQNINPSSYSRIEGNIRPIRLNDLQVIIDKLEIHPNEFFSFVTLDEEQQWFREKYFYCASHPTNQEHKKKLMNYYLDLENINQKTLRELSNYIAIKSLFHHQWDEVKRITETEVNDIYQLLIEKHYYFQYDYILINNLISFFNTKQADLLMMKAFPMPDAALRDSNTLSFGCNIWLNLISARLYSCEYELAEKYIHQAARMDSKKTNYYFHLNIKYLTHLTEYLRNGDPDSMKEISIFIKLLKDIGDEEFAERVDSEVRNLTRNMANNEEAKYPAISIRIN